MRGWTTQESTLWATGHSADHVRVRCVDVVDPDDSFDLCALDLGDGGRDWVREVSWEVNVENAVGTASFTLALQHGRYNASWIDALSKMNDAGGFWPGDQLIRLGRVVEIDAAITQRGVAALTTDWNLVFRGTITEIDVAPDSIRVQCQDQAGDLMRAWIEESRIYGWSPCHHRAVAWAATTSYSYRTPIRPVTPNGKIYEDSAYITGNSGGSEPTWPTAHWTGVNDGDITWICFGSTIAQYGAARWLPSHSYAVDDVVALPYFVGSGVTAREVDYIYRCTVAGTSGTTVPVMTGSDIPSITDGGATWKSLGFLMGGGVGFPVPDYRNQLEDILVELLVDWWTDSTLTVSAASGWFLSQYRQERMPLLEAMRSLAGMIGWDVRYVWNDGSFKLTLYEPDRTKSTVDYTFTEALVESLSEISVGMENIRNAIHVVYSDRAALSANGVDYDRKTLSDTDGTSISKYGRLWGEIAESSSSQIDTATEAQAMLTAALSDLSEPTARVGATLHHLFYPAELGDRYTFAADGKRFAADQTFAVVAARHSYSEGHGQTSLTLRGKVSGGQARWLRRMGMRGALTAPPQPPTSVGVDVATPGQAIIDFAPPRGAGVDFELYIHTATGFVPGVSYLVQRGRATRFVYYDNAATYYGRLLARDKDGNESSMSPQFSFTIA